MFPVEEYLLSRNDPGFPYDSERRTTDRALASSFMIRDNQLIALTQGVEKFVGKSISANIMFAVPDVNAYQRTPMSCNVNIANEIECTAPATFGPVPATEFYRCTEGDDPRLLMFGPSGSAVQSTYPETCYDDYFEGRQCYSNNCEVVVLKIVDILAIV